MSRFQIEAVASPPAVDDLFHGPVRTLAFPQTGSRVDRWAKRTLDVTLVLLALPVILPILVILALAVALDGGPVFYRHRRVGAGGRFFDCLKFRTMLIDAESCLEEYLSYHPEKRQEWLENQKLAYDPRITGIGRFLRASSLDELPQLINVLRGEMSLVGPRPVTSSELRFYKDAVELYCSVRPGITGLWQVSGRSGVGYTERVALDREYIESASLRKDCWLLVKTVPVVLSRRGAV